MWGWITGIFIFGLILLFLFLLLGFWGMSLGLYYRYHDFDTQPYYQPLNEKFTFSHLLNKLDKVIFAGIGVLEADIITDTERNTANGNAYKGNLSSFNLENGEQCINFFYSYGHLRITYIHKDTTIIKHFKIENIMNIGIQEQEDIADEMIKTISKKIEI